MATFPDYELITKGGISLGTNFELLSNKPLDSRLVVPSLEALQHYIDNAAAYEGMIAYVTSENKHYEVKTIDDILSYKQFGLTTEELNEIITNATTAAMEFKGATAELPNTAEKGDIYKTKAEFVVPAEKDAEGNGFTAKIGDSIVADIVKVEDVDTLKWYLIPSGDDIEDTWRPVTGINNNSTLTFVDGDKIDAVVATNGDVKFNHGKLTAAPADISTDEDKKTRTYLTAVEVDDYGHVTNFKTATENVEDTNTEYTFESQVESSSVYFNVTPDAEGATEQTVYVDAYSTNEADAKFKTKQATVADKITKKTQVLTKLTQNENGVIDYAVDELTLFDLGADLSVRYADGEISDAVSAYITIDNGGGNGVSVAIEDSDTIDATLNDDSSAFVLDLQESVKNSLAKADNSKQKQTVIDNKITKPAHVLSSLTQNTNGDIAYEVKELTPEDIGAVKSVTFESSVANSEPYGDNYSGWSLTVTVDDTPLTAELISDSLEFVPGGDGFQVVEIKDKAISAEKTKAYVETAGAASEEVWVFYCGTASILAD